MSDMRLNNLTVDLLQDQASLSLVKQSQPSVSGKQTLTIVSINLPIATPGNQPENHLRRIAVEEARRVLEEAIRTLDKTAA